MKNRILSLILAVCMVAVAIPALLLPVVAADTTGFTTKFSTTENWPSYTPGKSFDGWNGNWSVGYYDAGNYADFKGFDKTFNIISGSDNGQWTTTGLYLSEGRFITLVGSGEPYMTGAGPTRAFSITYNAPYEGTVDLSMEAIAPDSREESIPSGEVAALYFGVFVNDVMVFPTTGGSVLDPSAFALVSNLDDLVNDRAYNKLKNVEVNIGDRITFVAARYNTRYGSMVPVVTYHDGYELVPSRWQQSYGPSAATWPKTRNLSGTGLLTQTDPLWTLASYNTETKAVTEYAAQGRNTLGVWTGITRETTDFTKYNGIMLKHGGALTGAFMLAKPDAAEKPAYVGTALATGTLEFSAKESALYIGDNNANAKKNGNATVDVYINGEMKGTITVKSDSKGAASIVNTVKDVPVQKGDTVMYVANTVSEKTKFVNVQPNLIYTGITSFMTKTTTEKYDMEMDEASIVVSDKIGLQFNAYATVDTYRDATSADVYLWDATVTGEKTLANATAKIPMSVNTEFAYTAVYNTFAPKEMADIFTAQVVVLKGEETICQSEQKTFSVADAAQAQYEASYDQDEKDLMVAVMNYGAYAQKYFKYNTENLANKGLDAFQTTIDIEKYQYFSQFGGQMVGAATLLTYSELDAFSLYLEDTISIRLYINIDPYEKAVAEDMYVQFGGEDDYADNNNGVRLPVDRETGAALIENITLDQLSEVFYLRFVSVERTTTGTGTSRVYRYLGYTWTYSVESFAARMMDSTEANLPELLCALMELGKLA